ncbi:MAG: hypothetical protein WBG76_03775, partial [Ornithinimicrobium sp.]
MKVGDHPFDTQELLLDVDLGTTVGQRHPRRLHSERHSAKSTGDTDRDQSERPAPTAYGCLHHL